jgi:RNA polymerase sigma-70 factor (ECF subfamily)
MDFEEFFGVEHDPLLRMCWAVTLDREQARDVAQEAMCRAYERWDSLSGSNPAGWCHTVALNLIRSDWRRRQTARRTVVELRPSSDEVVNDPDLIAALARLSDRQREAVVLHYLLDLDVAACAERMGVSESSVKVHLHRGRVHLETLLGDELAASEV